MKKLLLIAMSTVAFSAHAWEPEIYVGGMGSAWQYQQPEVNASNFTINTIEGVAGMKLIEYLAVEGRLGVGMNSASDEVAFYVDPEDETTIIDRFAGEAEVSFYGSIYLKPMISNEKATLYGLIGFTTLESQFESFSLNNGAYSYDDTEGEVSLGAGASWVMNEHIELTAEWRNLINNDVVKMSGGTVGFIYKF